MDRIRDTSVDATVERAIFNFPSLYANRTQVLHHLFIVIGNGYEWQNGALVNRDPQPDRSDEDVQWPYRDLVGELIAEGAIAAEDVSEEMRELLARQCAEHEARNVEFLRRRRNAATLAQTPGPLAGHVYPPSGAYAHAINYPDDIALDWEAARREILAVAEPLWAAGDHRRIYPTPPLTDAATEPHKA